MAPRGPTSPAFNEISVRDFSDHEISRIDRRSLILQMTLQTKIIVPLHQKLPIDRPVWIVTHDASVSQRFMFEDKRTALLPMTLRATLIQPRHRQPGRRLQNFMAVRIVTLHAIHPSFRHRMMLRQVKFRVHIQMALETNCRVLSGINNESASPSANSHMLARRAMTRFAAGHLRKLDIVFIESPMRARRKDPHNIRMTISARRVPHEMCARNFRRRLHGALNRRTGNKN